MMLQVSGLKKNYGIRESVKSVSFHADVHEVVGLLGPNGAGKTTIMRMLAGYLAPTAGEIRLAGISMTENPQQVKGMIGYLPEIPPLYTYMTVTEHLQFVCSLRGIKGKNVSRECGRVCDLLNISHVAGRGIGKLSKGYRQRVGFAAALIGEPKLLILDEPTVGLDPQQVIEIRSLIGNLSKKMTIIISSHILSEIAGVCSRLLFLFEGNLLADGTMDTITQKYQRNTITDVSVRAQPQAAEQTMRLCAQEHGFLIDQIWSDQGQTHFVLSAPKDKPIEEFVFCAFAPLCREMALTKLSARRPSLEDIFLDITEDAAETGRDRVS